MDVVRKAGVSLIATAIVGLTLMAGIAPASATPPPDHKVTICHRTGSATNPYVEITVDIASSGYVKGGHSDHVDAVGNGLGGDIIPAYDYDPTGFHYDGLNLDTVIGGSTGADILANGCAIPNTEPKTVPYKLVRRMPLGVTKITLDAGLVPSISCDTATNEYVVTFGGANEQRIDVGVSRKGSVLRVRSEGIVLAVVRAVDIC